jgi:hypothetical protein
MLRNAIRVASECVRQDVTLRVTNAFKAAA